LPATKISSVRDATSLENTGWLTPSWALSYDLLSGDLAGPSTLRLQGLGLRFGVRYRF